MEMAVANIFHCENIPDQAVESGYSKRMKKLFCLVGKDFNIPKRKNLEVKYIFIQFLQRYLLIL